MLEARGISFSYGKDKAIYQGFSFSVAEGERVALKAPSGFGKTTLCRMLSGYLRPDAGEVLLDGKPLPRRGLCPVQMIWQHPEAVVDPRMRMAETLAEGGICVAGKPIKTVRDEGLPEAQRRILDELGIRDAWLSRHPHELSGGELQRFCIARALGSNPRYLVADEISTMLDAVTQSRIWHALLSEAETRNLGVVFVSHSPALTARIATRVVELG